MIYTTLGKTGLEVSRLGFGAMRLPMKEGKVDRELSIPMIHRAFELGVNFIDSAVMYCGNDSQAAVGDALKSWQGRRIYVSTKNHYYGTDEAKWWANLEESLQKLQLDSIDVYNLHGMRWAKFEERVKGPNGVLSWARKAYDQGLIKRICCSFHDTAENLQKIAETEEFESIILQYSLIYRDLEPVLPELKKRNIGVIIMGPVAGGRLGGESDQIRDLIPGAKSTAEVALRFVLANPNVDVAFSGMGEMSQVEENCAVASRAEPLTAEEKEGVEEAMQQYKKLADLYCTGCNYCLPCPADVQIPRNFTIANLERVYGLTDTARNQYRALHGKAAYCIACGECEEKCPQDIPIRKQLQDTARQFDEDYGKIRVHVLPDALELGEEVGLSFRLHLQNFSDQETKVTVSVRPGGGEHAEEETAEIGPLESFARADVPFEMTFERTEDFRGVELVLTTKSDLGEETSQVFLPLAEADALGEIRDLTDLVPLEETTPVWIDADDQLVEGEEKVLDTHGLTASLWHTENALLLAARVRDDCLAIAPKRDEQGRYDGLFLLLDWRRREHPVAPHFAEGVFLLGLYPCKDQKMSGFALCRRGKADVEKIEVESRPADGGYMLYACLPYEAFGIEPPRGEGLIGFDIGMQSNDGEGNRVMVAVWSGNQQVFRHPRLGYLFLNP
jgi:predicted aldo/keto reductase-like oxidoreductase